MGKDLIVESKVIAGDDVYAGFLLDVPVLKTEPLGLTKELGLGELASPVCFGCFLQVTVDSHARETEDRSVIDREVSIP